MSAVFDWQYPNAFVQDILVQEKDTDRLGHTNNVSYLRWLEVIAWSHMEHLDCGWQVNQSLGKAMAITRTEMNYLHASYANEQLVLGTWITKSDYRLTSEREFQLFRASDQRLLLTAKMIFACINLSTGKAAKMPHELKEAHQRAMAHLA